MILFHPQPVLIIAEPGDPHALMVAAHLRQRHSCDSFIWDCSRFPARDMLVQHVDSAGNVTVTLESPAVSKVSLENFGAVWWRRPQPARITQDVSEPHMRRYCQREAQSLLRGMLESLEIPVFNNPYFEERASTKPFQLKCAAESGLPVPETIMTNDPEKARRFYERLDGEVIFKSFTAVPGPMGGTQTLQPKHLRGLELLARAPVIFQRRIPPGRDVRVTVVGQRIFAAESNSKFLDWRIDQSVVWKKHHLPDTVAAGTRRLMSFLGLSFGSLDFRIAPNGTYMFLEINPNGQFLFLEVDDERLPVSSAFADFLVSKCEMERKVDTARMFK